jgi:hypothetical protein
MLWFLLACNNPPTTPTEAVTREVATDTPAPKTDPATAAPKAEVRREWKAIEKDMWNASWDRFEVGTTDQTDDPDFGFERAHDGTIITWRKPAESAEKQDDAALEKSIEAQLGTDPDVSARKLDVKVADGGVVLSGTVKSKEEEREACRLAINTPGVTRVTSNVAVK